MAHINFNYNSIQESYLFSEVAKKIKNYSDRNPSADIIRMGIGDVTRPLVKTVVNALTEAAQEMGNQSTFRGYGPEQGYNFLKERILAYYYNEFKVNLDIDEIFISDGAKSDIANITDIFSNDNIIVVPDPVYPVYVDTNVMLGRKINYIQGNEENGFLPMPTEDLEGDIFYLCSPNNPTGATYNREQLQKWVDFANRRNGIILFDAAYESFVEEDLPRSIYEIDDAKKCAIEFCSLSKTAGFTGTRCGYTIVPNALIRDNVKINKMWLRRQTTKFNGVSYIVQKGAAAVFSEEGLKEIRQVLSIYKSNAKIMHDTLSKLNIKFTGGINSPYLWFKCPLNMDSWSFFDFLLDKANVAGTPGSGFGKCGEGYFRLTAFNTPEKTKVAMNRINSVIGKMN